MNNQDSLLDLLTFKKPTEQNKPKEPAGLSKESFKRPESMKNPSSLGKHSQNGSKEELKNAKPEKKTKGFSGSFLDFSNLKGNPQALEKLRNAVSQVKKEKERERQKAQIQRIKEAEKNMHLRQERRPPPMMHPKPPTSKRGKGQSQRQVPNKRESVKKSKALRKQPEPGDIYCARCGAFHEKNFHKKAGIVKPTQSMLGPRSAPLTKTAQGIRQRSLAPVYEEEEQEEDLDGFIVDEEEEELDGEEEVRRFMSRMKRNRGKYHNDDLSDIEEANYETLAREEKKSSKIAKLEDDREFQSERMREQAKLKRRLK